MHECGVAQAQESACPFILSFPPMFLCPNGARKRGAAWYVPSFSSSHALLMCGKPCEVTTAATMAVMEVTTAATKAKSVVIKATAVM
jgi:hypothetical protein